MYSFPECTNPDCIDRIHTIVNSVSYCIIMLDEALLLSHMDQMNVCVYSTDRRLSGREITMSS